MSSSLLITLEMSGVLGVVLVFGFWQLWSLRREKERDKAREMAETADAIKVIADKTSDSPNPTDN